MARSLLILEPGAEDARRTSKEIHDLIPTTTPLDSLPFLLVRPSLAMKSDVLDDDGETNEIPSSKSVPPHSPPTPIVTTEHELPSVIVDLVELRASEIAAYAKEAKAMREPSELQRDSDVDGLLTAAETFELTIPVEVIPLDVPLSFEPIEPLDPLDETGPIMRPTQPRGRSRGFAIAALAALMAAGGTFAGLKVCHVTYHVPGGSLSAAPHAVR
jgi:hypothetical protein